MGEGYQFAVLGDNDADVDMLVAQVRSMAETEIARQYLQRATHRHCWMVGDDDEAAGRLGWNDVGDNGKPYNVVVIGRSMSWAELGIALESYEGGAYGC